MWEIHRCKFSDSIPEKLSKVIEGSNTFSIALTNCSCPVSFSKASDRGLTFSASSLFSSSCVCKRTISSSNRRFSSVLISSSSSAFCCFLSASRASARASRSLMLVSCKKTRETICETPFQKNERKTSKKNQGRRITNAKYKKNTLRFEETWSDRGRRCGWSRYNRVSENTQSRAGVFGASWVSILWLTVSPRWIRKVRETKKRVTSGSTRSKDAWQAKSKSQ